MLARVLWPGLSRVAKDGGAEPLAGQQGQLDRQSVVADGMAEGLLGLADPVLDTVLVQDEPLGGGLETAVLLQEWVATSMVACSSRARAGPPASRSPNSTEQAASSSIRNAVGQ